MRVNLLRDGKIIRQTETVASADNYLEAVRLSKEKKQVKDLIPQEDRPTKMGFKFGKTAAQLEAEARMKQESVNTSYQEENTTDSNQSVDYIDKSLYDNLNTVADLYEPYDHEVAEALRGHIKTTEEIQKRTIELLSKHPELLFAMKHVTDAMIPETLPNTVELTTSNTGKLSYTKPEVKQEEVVEEESEQEVQQEEETVSVPYTPETTARPFNPVIPPITAPFPAQVDNVSMNCEEDDDEEESIEEVDESSDNQEPQDDKQNSKGYGTKNKPSSARKNPAFYSRNRDMSNY